MTAGEFPEAFAQGMAAARGTEPLPGVLVMSEEFAISQKTGRYGEGNTITVQVRERLIDGQHRLREMMNLQWPTLEAFTRQFLDANDAFRQFARILRPSPPQSPEIVVGKRQSGESRVEHARHRRVSTAAMRRYRRAARRYRHHR